MTLLLVLRFIEHHQNVFKCYEYIYTLKYTHFSLTYPKIQSFCFKSVIFWELSI